MKDVLTVGKLRESLEDVPDDLEVRLSSDSGVGQGMGEIVIEDAYRVTYDLPKGQKFADTEKTCVDYFTIYANEREADE